MASDIRDEQPVEASLGWWLFVLAGGVSLIAGVILVTEPGDSLAALAVIVGIFLLVDGIVELGVSFGRSGENRVLAVLVGVLGIIVGLLLIRHPTHAVTAIGLLIGVWLVAAGAVRLILAITSGTQTVLRSVIALLEICVGVVVISAPHIGYGTLAVLVGLWLIVSGVGTIILGVALKKGRALRATPRSGRPVPQGGEDRD